MSKGGTRNEEIAMLDALVEEIIVDAYNDDEQLSGFASVIEDELSLPADAVVIGESVAVMKIDYEGGPLRGLTARCRCEDGAEYEIAAADVLFPEGSKGARYIAAYRRWMGIDPWPTVKKGSQRRRGTHKAKVDDFSLSESIELVALAVKANSIRCRLLNSDRELTFRLSAPWEVAPGWIIDVRPRKQWRFAGHPYLTGEIESTRLDVEALALRLFASRIRTSGNLRMSTGVRMVSRSRSGPGKSSPAVRDGGSRWSRC